MKKILKINNGKLELTEKVKLRPYLVHAAVIASQAARRTGTKQTLGRSNVSSSKRKMYRQKGTGNARAGHRSSPVRVGGGHAFAFVERDFTPKVNRKARRNALRDVFLSRVGDGAVRVVDAIKLSESKTRLVAQFVEKHDLDGKVLILTAENRPELVRAAANLPYVTVARMEDAGVEDVAACDDVVIEKSAIEIFEGRCLS